jgi:hypothetical protein
VTVIGGLVTSTFLTLLVIPSVYTLVDDVQVLLASLPKRMRRLVGRFHAEAMAPRPNEGSVGRTAAASFAQD